MPIDLYYNPFSSPSNAVLMCFKQLSLDVNIKTIDIKSGDHLTPEYQKLNPNKQVPTIVDNDLVLSESGAIMRYLANAYAPNSSLYPSEPKERAIVDKWLDFSTGFHESFKTSIVKKALNGAEPNVKEMDVYNRNMKAMDTLIGDNQYVAGNGLTIADLSVFATTQSLSRIADQELNGYPNYKQWFERMKKTLPNYNEFFD